MNNSKRLFLLLLVILSKKGVLCMFRYIPLKEQVMEERRKNAVLQAQADKNTSDIDYIAMMCDVELDTDGEQEDTDYEQ